MTKVPLRAYNREIEGMIEASQLDEATAHCQQILKTFPMCVETYRLLGKTFLEARKYGDAADIFQRALMAVPDDFVSHVGMSIIRDDEGKLDEAIWHMERAFEIQPSNSAIQGELRRLYGRRGGAAQDPPQPGCSCQHVFTGRTFQPGDCRDPGGFGR
jgi:predicted Zn-dependent protease